MSGKKNKRLLGVISIFLWAVILTIVLRSYLEETGNPMPVFAIVLLVCAAAFFGWWFYMSMRISRLVKRLGEAGFQYQTTHDAEAYLSELDECARMPGAEKITLSSMPARNYITILKIRTLREAGRAAEASALLEAARTEITDDRARQLLKAEKEQLQDGVLKARSRTPHTGGKQVPEPQQPEQAYSAAENRRKAVLAAIDEKAAESSDAPVQNDIHGTTTAPEKPRPPSGTGFQGGPAAAKKGYRRLTVCLCAAAVVLMASGIVWRKLHPPRPLHEQIADYMYHSRTDPKLEYCIEKYGDEFTATEYGSILSTRFPNFYVRLEWSEEEKTYKDNYIVYLRKEELERILTPIGESVFGECKLFVYGYHVCPSNFGKDTAALDLLAVSEEGPFVQIDIFTPKDPGQRDEDMQKFAGHMQERGYSVCVNLYYLPRKTYDAVEETDYRYGVDIGDGYEYFGEAMIAPESFRWMFDGWKKGIG